MRRQSAFILISPDQANKKNSDFYNKMSKLLSYRKLLFMTDKNIVNTDTDVHFLDSTRA